jgi:hypothetical protein
MESESAARTTALILGIVLVVGGVGAISMGYNQMQAADEWASQIHICGITEDSAPEPECPPNPYAGGGGVFIIGVIVVVVGGVAARWGAQ